MSGINISSAELEVLNILWESPNGMLLADICAAVKSKNKTWEISTIRTFLIRLEEKKAIYIVKEKRLNRYVPNISKKQFASDKTQFLINDYFEGNPQKLLAHLIEESSVSSDDLDELRSFWNERKKKP